MIDPRIQRAALELNRAGVVTDRELDAYALHAAGNGYMRIALHLGISRGAARDRYKRAERKISDYLKEQHDAA
jgi:DNA-binding CsgD family transcriptional regulator